ncbi:sphingomyelin phosphodiesterase [Streptomyces jumonjinensis]|uniref:Endonuclease/exonuclease/phosphatase domain-containing protein n=1 Tax=Streptomyces jumonjinensis TaxID=1945 RepID=A0A646KPW1_STRJU|nr:sphingomyelin phosphodiesterase [Streptomyces jumonjinensis]MQT04359.1 hypothetical protein [Streptomyces jumonjinensis]
MSTTVKVANYNTMLLPWIVSIGGDDFHNADRVAKILKLPFLQGNDVVVLEELFNIAPSTALLNGLHDAGYIHQTRVVGADDWPDRKQAMPWNRSQWTSTHTEPENGGIAIVSRHPITWAEQLIYADGCGWDHESAKGFAYARVEKDGRTLHVVGTHPQSTDTGCGDEKSYRQNAAKIRHRQFTQLDDFLTEKEHTGLIPSGEPVLLVGDFNVDRHDRAEYSSTLATLRAEDAARTGRTYSFDTKANTLAHARYPDDGPEDLDLALQRTGHTLLENWTVDVSAPTTAAYTVTAGGKHVEVTDPSDHYPIVATGVLPEPPKNPSTLRVDKVTITAGDDSGGDDLYGEITVNGRRVWHVERDDALSDKKPPYQLPGVDHGFLASFDGNFVVTALVWDSDSPDPDDELVRQSVTVDGRTAPGPHTVHLTGLHGAADLTYTLQR